MDGLDLFLLGLSQQSWFFVKCRGVSWRRAEFLVVILYELPPVQYRFSPLILLNGCQMDVRRQKNALPEGRTQGIDKMVKRASFKVYSYIHCGFIDTYLLDEIVAEVFSALQTA